MESSVCVDNFFCGFLGERTLYSVLQNAPGCTKTLVSAFRGVLHRVVMKFVQQHTILTLGSSCTCTFVTMSAIKPLESLVRFRPLDTHVLG